MSQGLARSATLYYNDLLHTRLVSSPKEERQLIYRWQKRRDMKARDTLIKSHLRFVVTCARKWSRDPDRLSDLIASGNLGLLKALDKFDLSRKPPTRFLTYAGWWIQKEIADEDYATSTLVHVPTHRQKAQRRQAKEFQRVLQAHGPNSKKLTKMSPGAPEGISVSIDALHETVDDTPIGASNAFDTVKTDLLLRRIIGGLPLREQTVLNLYFGVKDEPRNLVQISAILGMCPERVRQIKITGMKQLRALLSTKDVDSADDAY